MANEELRDPLFPRERDDFRDRVAAFQNMHLRAEFAGVFEIALKPFVVFAAQVARFHRNGEKLSVEALGRTGSARKHFASCAAGCHAYEDTLLRAPALRNVVRIHVALQLFLDYLSGEQQCDLAQV